MVGLTEVLPDMPNVGRSVRSLRDHKKMSLRELSELCGLSVNAISKIERGENSPTVASLHKLASALNVPITDFFKERSSQNIVFTQGTAGVKIQGDGVRIEGLGGGISNQQLEPFRMVIDPQASTTNDLASHSGEEFVYCLEGELEYVIGRQRFHLKPGDSLLFKASQPHGWQNSGELPAVVLLVFESDQAQPVPHRY
jgi:transcriptional regulator with XRE-family HTH domain